MNFQGPPGDPAIHAAMNKAIEEMRKAYYKAYNNFIKNCVHKYCPGAAILVKSRQVRAAIIYLRHQGFTTVQYTNSKELLFRRHGVVLEKTRLP